MATSATPERDDESALFERWQREREPAARTALVERYLPLARRLARRYAQGDEPLDDLVQVASLGLVKAVDRFDAARPIAFSSFAVPTILGELKRHFRDRTWSVRVPRDLQELALRADRTAEDLACHLGRQPTVSELAEGVGTSEEQ
ncbi:MAG TPA: sigma-70 family RNA polymerase sigma factor, partial [Solirubrobacteraceae bacterium]|nr:sigma-70 family RNA polymerase sigma factor [Solirubrobacteraceae bacterium]